MGDHDERPLRRGQILFEPVQRLEVQIVRWLVQEQQVRVRKQRSRQTGSRPLPAAGQRCRSVQCRVGQPDSECRPLRQVLVFVAA